MRTIMFYAREFSWSSADQDSGETRKPFESSVENAVVVFIHAEPGDDSQEQKTVARFLKQVKQIARKWDTKRIVLYPFSHLGEEKADKEVSQALIEEMLERLRNVGYEASRTAFGSFVDFRMTSPGAALSRAFRQY